MTSNQQGEDTFILRLPEKHAKKLRQALEHSNDLGGRFSLQLGGNPSVNIDGEELDAKLFNLPTIIETHKTLDKKFIYKVGDIHQSSLFKKAFSLISRILSFFSQMVVASEKTNHPETAAAPHPDGLTAPMHNARENAFRKSVMSALQQPPEIMEEVTRLINADDTADAFIYYVRFCFENVKKAGDSDDSDDSDGDEESTNDDSVDGGSSANDRSGDEDDDDVEDEDDEDDEDDDASSNGNENDIGQLRDVQSEKPTSEKLSAFERQFDSVNNFNAPSFYWVLGFVILLIVHSFAMACIFHAFFHLTERVESDSEEGRDLGESDNDDMDEDEDDENLDSQQSQVDYLQETKAVAQSQENISSAFESPEPSQKDLTKAQPQDSQTKPALSEELKKKVTTLETKLEKLKRDMDAAIHPFVKKRHKESYEKALEELDRLKSSSS
eukprot:gene23-3419_t